MSVVTTRHHAIVRQIRAIRKGEDRHLLLDGWHLVADAARAGIRMPWVAVEADRTDVDPALLSRVHARGSTVLEVSTAVMQALSPARTPAGIVAIADRPSIAPQALVTPPPALVLAAFGVQDPGNVGALMRSVEAAGATGLLLDGQSADPWGWKALRGAMGSAFRVPVVRDEHAEATVDRWRHEGLAILVTDPHEGSPMHAIDLVRASVVVLGSEGHGVPAEVASLADARVRVPMRPPVESLNVAVAGALLVYEAARQRGTLR